MIGKEPANDDEPESGTNSDPEYGALLQWAFGELPLEQRPVILQRMQSSPVSRQYVEQWQMIRDAIRELPELTARTPEDADEPTTEAELPDWVAQAIAANDDLTGDDQKKADSPPSRPELRKPDLGTIASGTRSELSRNWLLYAACLFAILLASISFSRILINQRSGFRTADSRGTQTEDHQQDGIDNPVDGSITTAAASKRYLLNFAVLRRTGPVFDSQLMKKIHATRNRIKTLKTRLELK